MQQTSPEALGLVGVFRLGWRPSVNTPGIYVHTVTAEEIVCHRLRIPADQLQK